MRPFTATLLALAVAVSLPALAEAQQAGATIEGVVRTSDTGEPVVGAAVRLAEPGLEAITGPHGGFRFEVPAGTYTLEVTSLGRVFERREVVARAGAPRPIDVALAPEALEAREIRVVLDRFRLVRDRRTVAGSAHVLGPDELDEQKLLFDDVHDVLRRVPGVNIQEEEGYGLRPNIGIRGTGSERSSKITLMEDGVLIAPAPYAAPSAYYFPVVGRMNTVEVRKGSSQIVSGPHTIGGAINMLSTPIPNEFSVNADLEGGEDASGKAYVSIGDAYEHVAWMAETYQVRTDGFKEIDGGGDSGFEISDFVGKLRLNTAPDAATYQELVLKLQYYDETSDETYLGLTNADFAADPFRRYAASRRDVMRADHSQVQLRWFLQPSDALDLTTVAYRNDFARNWFKLGKVNGVGIENVLEDPAAFPEELAWLRGATSPEDALNVRANNREYYGAGVQSILGTRFERGGARHEIELGVRYHRDEEDRFQHEDLFQMVDGFMVRTTEGAPGSQSNRVSEAEAWSLHLHDDIAFGRWTVSPGVRLESIDFTRTDFGTDDPDRIAPTRVRESSVTEWIPGIGATFDLTPELALYGGVHEGFGPPGPGSDEATEPESSVNWELGARFERGDLLAQATVFTTDYDNILGRATLSSGDPTGSGEAFNGGAVDVRGLELSLDYDPARRDATFRFPAGLAYTFTSAEFQSAFESDFDPWGTVEVGDELPYIPEHQLNASVGIGRGPWLARLEATHVSEMRTEAGRGPIPVGSGTDAYTTFDLSAEFVATPWSTVFAGVQNLTDEAYVVARRPAGARPGLPRTFLAGVRLTR